MNLGKLLVAGKSVINGCAEVSYRANRHVYLPKFGLAQNPFKSPDEAEPAKPVAVTTGAESQQRAFAQTKLDLSTGIATAIQPT